MDEPLRRLAYTPAPEPGEHFASWVRRAADDLFLPPGRMLSSLGVRDTTTSSDVRPRGFGILLTGDTAAALRFTTGLSDAALRDMHLERFAGTLFRMPGPDEPVSHWAQHNGVLPSSSRGCGACLAAAPVWPAWWRLGAASCCPIHRIRLADACPNCAVPLFRTSARAEGLSRKRLLDPGVCNHLAAGILCGRPWTVLPRDPATAAEVDAMTAFLNAAEGGRCYAGGHPVTASVWLDAHRRLCFIAQRSTVEHELPPALGHVLRRHVEDTRTGRAKPTVGQAPESAALAAALNLVANRILAARPDDGTDLLTELAANTTGGHVSAASIAGRSPVLAVLLARHAHTSVVALPSALRGTLSWSEIPQVMPSPLVDPELLNLIPGTSQLTLRVFLSLAVAKRVHGAGWAHAGRTLGLPDQVVRRAVNRPIRKIVDPNAVNQAISALCEQLADAHIDYAARRRGAADVTTVPFSVMKAAGLGVVTESRQMHAAGWLWENWAGGHPDTFAGRRGRRDTFIEMRKRFSSELTGAQASHLTGWMGSACGRAAAA